MSILKKIVWIAVIGLVSVNVFGKDLGKRLKICLNGEWQIKFVKKMNDDIPKKGWTTARVPTMWGTAGKYNFTYPEVPGATAQWYQRDMMIPREWRDGRRIKLRFQALQDAHKVFLNGKLIFSSGHVRLCNEIDITSVVRFGQKNRLNVVTKRLRRGFGCQTGNLRSVYLRTVPKVNINYALAIPSVRKMTLSTKIQVANESKKDGTYKISVTVNDKEGRSVLSFPTRELSVKAGEKTQVKLEKPWADPIIWGFGDYGQLYKYELVTKVSGNGVDDVKYDTFGFREFYTEGTKFMFNGKEFFIKGDLLTRNFNFIENPSAIAAYYYRQRQSNINFQRMHSMKHNFDSRYWYSVADEMGYLVEAQLSRLKASNGLFAPDSPEVLQTWHDYVIDHFNHPSLVMWSLDNESFSVGHINQRNLQKVDIKLMKEFGRLSDYVRKLDPSRIVESHHNYTLFAFAKMNMYNKKNLPVFNIHPYGTIKKVVNSEAKAVAFDYDVPILIGELISFPKPLDFVNNLQWTYAEQWRIGRSLYNQITEGAKAKGVGGIVLCSLEGDGYIGFQGPGKFYLGPWSDHAIVRDKKNPDTIKEIRDFRVKVKWPSLSGEGAKADSMLGYSCKGGWTAQNFNWFDPTRPIFYPNIANEKVKQAYHDVDGKNVSKLSTRAPEAVICFGIKGKPVEGAYVFVTRNDRKPVKGVTTDKDGTAWFQLEYTGDYIAFCRYKGKTYKKEFTINRRPAVTGKAGYDYITWVDMGGIDIAERKKWLSKGAEFTHEMVFTPGENIKNGSMEAWHSPSSHTPLFWKYGLTKRSTTARSGKFSASVKGNNAKFLQHLALKRGSKYRIKASIRKEAGNSCGKILIRTGGNYAVKFSAKGSEQTGEWVDIDETYVADGSEKYLYCFNSYMGPDGECLYDNISVKEIPGDKKLEEPFLPGPFNVSKGGFIRNWLVLGPIPNRGNEEQGFEGHETDWLKEYGGELEVKPKFGEKVAVKFPADFYWKPGIAQLSWRSLNSTKDQTRLGTVQLPEMAVFGNPPSNVCAYLSCTVISPVEQNVTLGIGSDDGYKVFLNHKKVGEKVATRGSSPDQEKYQVTLKKGQNTFLMKVFQAIGGWNCYVHFLNPDGTPVTNIKIKLEK